MNIALRITNNAKKFPDKTAVIFPERKKNGEYFYHKLTFRELENKSNQFAHQLVKMGLKNGDRTLLFLKPSLDFHAMTFALFKIGVIPIFIDPGMGKKNLLKCIKESSPVALIAEKEIHFIKLFYRSIFKNIKFNVSNGNIFFQKLKTIEKMKKEKVQHFAPVIFQASDTAAILFTSGGTGTPKGVVYTHEIFERQTDLLQEMYHLTESDIDLPAFPLFSLFTLAMGMTSCIPDMDPSKPIQCDPKKLYKNIMDLKPTFVAGSPAIWERLADYCTVHSLELPSIKNLVMFGAPVSVNIHRKFRPLLTNGTTYTPYGATEALPICNISGEFILKHTSKNTEEGAGTCVGLPAPHVSIKIIKSTEAIIKSLESAEILPPLEVGEIIVKGLTITKEYLDLPEKTAEAKIYENNEVWHRMGDVGYLDLKGMLWFCGRKSHQVTTQTQTLYPIPCESIFNKHPAVKRSALVGIKTKNKIVPSIVIERFDQQYLSGKDKSLFENELFQIAKNYPHTKEIKKIYLSKTFPVDVRHNIKIDRLKLKDEIEQLLKDDHLHE